MKKQVIAAVTIASLLGFAGGTAVQAFQLRIYLKGRRHHRFGIEIRRLHQ